jgi:hypothetical protein
MCYSQQYLTSDDMAKIERVLTQAGFHKSETASGMDKDAASFLAREFQDGVTNEADLALSLERYLTRRASWRAAPGNANSSRKAEPKPVSKASAQQI